MKYLFNFSKKYTKMLNISMTVLLLCYSIKGRLLMQFEISMWAFRKHASNARIAKPRKARVENPTAHERNPRWRNVFIKVDINVVQVLMVRQP